MFDKCFTTETMCYCHIKVKSSYLCSFCHLWAANARKGGKCQLIRKYNSVQQSSYLQGIDHPENEKLLMFSF